MKLSIQIDDLCPIVCLIILIESMCWSNGHRWEEYTIESLQRLYRCYRIFAWKKLSKSFNFCWFVFYHYSSASFWATSLTAVCLCSTNTVCVWVCLLSSNFRVFLHQFISLAETNKHGWSFNLWVFMSICVHSKYSIQRILFVALIWIILNMHFREEKTWANHMIVMSTWIKMKNATNCLLATW